MTEAEVEAVLDLACRGIEALEGMAAELYRIRVAVEVLAGDALDREDLGGVHPAGSMRERAATELDHIAQLDRRLGFDRPRFAGVDEIEPDEPESDPDPYGTSS